MEQVGFWSSRPSRVKQQAASLSKQQISVLNAALTAGLYDSVAPILCTPSVDVLEQIACTVETPQGKAQVHPSSVNRSLQTHGWLLYQEKVPLNLGFRILNPNLKKYLKWVQKHLIYTEIFVSVWEKAKTKTKKSDLHIF